MPRRRVIAYYMHEHEEIAVRQALPAGEFTEAFAVGEADDADIAALGNQGVVVEILPDEMAAMAATAPGAHAAPAAAAPAGAGLDLAAAAAGTGAASQYRIVLAGPLLESQRSRLLSLGLGPLHATRASSRGGSTQQLALRASMDDLTAQHVQALDFVRQVEPLAAEAPPAPAPPPEDPAEDVRQARTAARSVLADAGQGAPVPHDILVDESGNPTEVKAWLEAKGATDVVCGRSKVRATFPADDTWAALLAARPDIVRFEVYVPRALFNGAARAITGAEQLATGAHGLTGAGQIVGVADTGLDSAHGDFRNRVRQVFALGRPGQSDDPHGHGTHVAGTILGDGATAGLNMDGTRRNVGLAPGAELVMQSLLDANNGLGGLPLELDTLFQQAYDAGARIHNNSWGASVGSHYTVDSLEVDRFVHEHPDMLVVIAAGNEGTGDPTFVVPPGFVDELSIGAPATSKNALVVGASCSTTAASAVGRLAAGMAWARRFPVPPVSNQPVSGNATEVAPFSSRGPCTDGRVKPDVVAPGTDIRSSRSSAAPDRNYWGIDADAPATHAYMGGTSMAAPVVAGLAALVREWYGREGHASPSAALLKATLVNGTQYLNGPFASAQHPVLPNYHQGFGRVDLLGSIPNDQRPALRLSYVDTLRGDATAFATGGQRRRWSVQVAAGESLRMCLAWTDPPGRAIQNVLHLTVDGPGPTGQLLKWTGNTDLPDKKGPMDNTNNVQVVRIEAPVPGTYTIVVASKQIVKPVQHFALVVAGAVQPLQAY